MLETLLGMHLARRRTLGRESALDDPRVMALHRQSAPELLRSGMLRLRMLRIAGRPAAGCLALLANDARLLFYLTGFDPALSYESSGTILLGSMLEEAVAEGRRELHFLRGGEHYKHAWGAVDRINAAIRLRPT